MHDRPTDRENANHSSKRAMAMESRVMNDSVERLIAYRRENSRVCPVPQRWSDFWTMLPNRSRVGAGWESPLPLILAAWHETSASEKMLRLTAHIEWADKFGALESVATFLHSLREDEWFHLGDC